MGKIERRFKIDYPLDWTYGIDIKKLREDLDAIEKLGATHVEIEPYESYGSAGVEIQAVADRLETDEEYKARIDAKVKRDEDTKRYELAQLEALKLKYK